MVRSFGLGIPRSRNVYIGKSVLLVVTSRNITRYCEIVNVMVRSFGLVIPGTRNVYIFVSSIFNAHSNVNITSSRNSEPKRTYHN